MTFFMEASKRSSHDYLGPGSSGVSSTIVIFGASGDLTTRKLIPALYQLHRRNRLPPQLIIVGLSRSPFSQETWRTALGESTRQHAGGDFDWDSWAAFARTVYYHRGDLARDECYPDLARSLDALDGGASARVYYLSTSPRLYEPAIEALGRHGLATEKSGPRRLVVEKPFGTDRASAMRLNRLIHQVFNEDQVYRIDHYLGKETVQNIFVLRFANSIFEPIWNRNYVDHVQITVAEEIDVGSRGDYYDAAGVVRDMFQNHLLQLVALTAMEPPIQFDAEQIRDEKVKVLKAIRPLNERDVAVDTIRGQYHGYRTGKGVAPQSETATFAAVKLFLDNWRWQGVPFYLRSGKAMSCRTTQLVIQFRPPPHCLFPGASSRGLEANRLVIQIQPAEGIQLHFATKVPDAGMQLLMTDLDFRFCREFRGHMPEAYERLLLDILAGDASLFTRSDEVEEAWGIVDPILVAWTTKKLPPLFLYEPGQWGPAESTDWMRSQGREWFDTCPVLR